MVSGGERDVQVKREGTGNIRFTRVVTTELCWPQCARYDFSSILGDRSFVQP